MKGGQQKMQEIVIKANEAGQRLDKMLAKYLNLAPKGFIYKMLRKKNITLNGKKADGSERLLAGDSVKFFLSDETIAQFTKKKFVKKKVGILPVIYEDSHIIIVNKPSGMLSQKAEEQDISVVELLLAHLLQNGSLTEGDLKTFTPSVCNRLDRNTSGILIAGKSLIGLQTMAEALKRREFEKYYLCIILGELKESCTVKGFLYKDRSSNFVTVASEKAGKDFLPIETRYEPLASNGCLSLLRVKLITGRSHQIRAHLASIHHPVIGDFKYGDEQRNRFYRNQYRIRSQLLHAYELKMPILSGELSYLSGKQFFAPLPNEFTALMEREGLLWQHGIPEG